MRTSSMLGVKTVQVTALRLGTVSMPHSHPTNGLVGLDSLLHRALDKLGAEVKGSDTNSRAEATTIKLPLPPKRLRAPNATTISLAAKESWLKAVARNPKLPPSAYAVAILLSTYLNRKSG